VSTRPIDIIAAALSENGWVPSPSEGAPAATVAANTLTDERIVANAVQALTDLGLREYLSNGMIEHAARVVLRSVGGA
jgi:hypothetical protein